MATKDEHLLRALESGDFHKGYLKLLTQLTVVGHITEEEFLERLEKLRKLGDLHHVLVVEDLRAQTVVASGTLFVEEKFVRSCGKVGHIEDVVVDKNVRGLHLGQRVIAVLTEKAKEVGCYKVILDCSVQNAPFYEKCGFFRKEVQMAQYF